MRLDPQKDYGFTVLYVADVEQLPEWDRFRFEKIKHIFQCGGNIIDFGSSSRALSPLLLPPGESKSQDFYRYRAEISPRCGRRPM